MIYITQEQYKQLMEELYEEAEEVMGQTMVDYFTVEKLIEKYFQLEELKH